MAETRSRVLIFIAHYLPGYKAGGPVRTIANLVEQLGRDIEFWIVTSDRDLGDIHSYPNIRLNEWQTVGNSKVMYVSPNKKTFRNFVRIIKDTPHKVLYLNSFFDPVFTQYPLIARRLGLIPQHPTIVAPRGEFSERALNIKRLKKLIYVNFAKFCKLYHNVIWQASNDIEYNNIRKVMRGCVKEKDIIVAPNVSLLTITKDTNTHVKSKSLPLRILFLSRISPMKNLVFALSVLRDVGELVEFNIYGPCEDKRYWEKCKKLMINMPDNISVHYRGEVPPLSVLDIMASHDLFFLPTLGENYGHVIAEALSAGTPVLISDRTPWRSLEKEGVGWDIPLYAKDKFVEVIRYIARMADDDYRKIRLSAMDYANRVLGREEILEANRKLFMKLL